MGHPDDPVRVVMKRTIANLQFIDQEDERLKAEARANGLNRRDDDQAPFEATQLLNSFLGALIHPWETLRERSGQGIAIGLDEARSRGWPVLQNQNSYAPEPKNYARMLSNLRNAFAHGSIELLKDLPDETGRRDISGVRIWNQCPDCSCKTWVAEISLAELRAFLEFFENLADDQLPRHRTARSPGPRAPKPQIPNS
jgi:hypothetical protein